ncbi:MAG: L,D-transpeptidase [Verrucomicrobia bacterium]|nr:L,D-transpeptidase [Verrucomicrobiota bacterium]
MDDIKESISKTCAALGIKPADRLLVVRIGAQTLQFFRGGELVRAYPACTSLKPPSNVKDSLGTPRGLHEIAERIGGEQPAGMVFKSRRPTGRHFSEHEDNGNLITSRILWLRGLEPGRNAGRDEHGNVVDTYDRYVYIHGTNREDRLGHPHSAGCVLLGNQDIVGLYDEVRVGDHVVIVD